METMMALDLGNPIDQQTRDDAHGRAYEWQDEMEAARSIRRDRELPVIAAMEQTGGSFVKSLAQTMRMADQNNYEAIRDALPKIWKSFQDRARESSGSNAET